MSNAVDEFLANGGVITQCEAQAIPKRRKPRAKQYNRTVTKNRYDQYLKQTKRKAKV